MTAKTEIATREEQVPGPAAFNMKPEIAAAVAKVMGKVKRLGKAEKNTYDNYNFTSIDQFLEFVNPLMAEAGLFPLYQEIGQEYYENKKGSLWMRVRYAFYLCHESGAVAGPFNRTVAVPMTGAQSYGSAQSYALKQFLRATFMIPTGDKDDADYNEKDEHQAAPNIPPAAISEEQQETLHRLLRDIGAGEAAFLKYYNIRSVDELPPDKFEHAKKALEKKLAEQAKVREAEDAAA